MRNTEQYIVCFIVCVTRVNIVDCIHNYEWAIAFGQCNKTIFYCFQYILTICYVYGSILIVEYVHSHTAINVLYTIYDHETIPMPYMAYSIHKHHNKRFTNETARQYNDNTSPQADIPRAGTYKRATSQHHG